SLFIGGATFAAIAILFLSIRTRPAAVWLLLGLAGPELAIFGRTSVNHFELADAADPPMQRFLERLPGDYRRLNLATRPNEALSLRAQEIWGYNPGVLKRYSQLVGFTQGVPPDQATEFVRFTRDHRLLAMLRCRYLFLVKNNQVTVQES